MSDWVEGVVETRGRPSRIATSNITKINADKQLSEVLFDDKDIINDHATVINKRTTENKQKRGLAAHRKLRFLPHD